MAGRGEWQRLPLLVGLEGRVRPPELLPMKYPYGPAKRVSPRIVTLKGILGGRRRSELTESRFGRVFIDRLRDGTPA